MSEIGTRPERLKPRGGLTVQYAAIRALFLRELQTRFGHYRLGYLWAILEPGLQVIFFLIIFGAVMKRAIPGMDYSLFLINGMLPFFMFMRSATRSLSAVESNTGLFSYRSVKPIDALIARTALESAIYFIVYIFFSGVLLWLGIE
ncbi:MAG: ABC transporter permease, partial [Moraxellaceae bacterium]